MMILSPGTARRFSNVLRRLVSACLILPCLILAGHGSAVAKMKVQGTVFSNQGKPAGNVEVVLMKITMQQKPVLVPFKQSRTDRSGRFEFHIEPQEGNVFFRIKAGSGNLVTGSEPFRMNVDQSVKKVQLVLPGRLEGLSHLSFDKHIVVFEALGEALQITEVINLSNNSGSIVDTSGAPLIKRISAKAVNFEFFKRGRFQALREKDRIVFKLEVPPGDHQLLYSYHLPVSSRAVDFSAYPPLTTREFEMVTPSNALDLSFDRSRALSSAKTVSQEKQFNNRSYHSLTAFLDGNQAEIKIRIGNIPISQERFFYPAMVLAAILILGLMIFLAKRPPSALNKGRR